MRVSLFACLLFLSACKPHTVDNSHPEVLTPIPYRQSAVVDPSDKLLKQSVQDYLLQIKAPANTRYELTRIDLNNDGRREGLVRFVAPYHYWCSQYGCSVGVFKANNYSFSMNTRLSQVQGAIFVSDYVSNGWQDLIVRVPGTNLFDRSKEVVLRFDGGAYPSYPERQPPIHMAYNKSGVKVLP